MAVNLTSIAKSYWRLIKGELRTYDSIDETMKALVDNLAKEDVKNGVIIEAEYENYICKKYEV